MTPRIPMTTPTKYPRIHVTEFAAVLHGTNHGEALVTTTLRRFGATVRSDRRFVVKGHDQDANEEEEDMKDDDDDDEIDSTVKKNAGDTKTHSKDDDDDDDDIVPMKSSSSPTDEHRKGHKRKHDDDDDNEKKEVASSTTHKKPNPKKPSPRHHDNDSWKDDIASYDVPFVGTSLYWSHRTSSSGSGDHTHHTHHHHPPTFQVWPSGLLHAYLTTSPHAMELWQPERFLRTDTWSKTSSSHHNTAAAARLLHAYLQVVSEVVTAALVPRKWRFFHEEQRRCRDIPEPWDDNDTDEATAATTTEFLPTSVWWSQLMALWSQTIITTTTNHGKPPSSLPTLHSRWSTTTTILSLCHRYSLISVAHARMVVRRWVEPQGEGGGLSLAVLRSLLSYPPVVVESVGEPTKDRRPSPQQSVYIAAVHLVATWIEMKDFVIMNALLCPSNNNNNNSSHSNNNSSSSHHRKCDSKTPPPRPTGGMLHVLLQRGVPTATQLSVDHHHQASTGQRMNVAMVRLLRSLRRLLLDPGPVVSVTTFRHNKSSSSSRSSSGGDGTSRHYHHHLHCMLLDLFTTRDCLSSLVAMARHWAPPIFHWEQVLSHTDPYEPATTTESTNVPNDSPMSDDQGNVPPQQHVGIEARRLLFLLLSDPIHSPLLRSINGRSNHRSSATIHKNDSTIQLIIRTITNLLSSDNASGNHASMIEMQRFIIHTVTTTPLLLPALLRVIPVGDDLPRQMMSTLAQLNFVSTLLRRGPGVIHCLEPTDSVTDDTGNGKNATMRTIDAASCAVVPTSLKKQKLLKLLQNSNALVAYEGYKVLLIMIHRCRDYINDLCNDREVKIEDISKAIELLQQALPDLPALMNGLNKLNSVHALPVDLKSTMMLLTCAGEVLRTYCSVFLTSNERLSVSLDLSKLLPNSTKVFLSLPIFMQRTMLATIRYLIQRHQSIVSLQPHLTRTMLELTVSTRSPTIYQETRAICMMLLSQVNSNSDYETCYEASCWVDGITKATLAEFSSSLLKDSANTMPPISMQLVQAWRKANLPLNSIPTRPLSTLLIRGIKHMNQASLEFGALVAQILTRCLFSHENPVPLAVMILEFIKCDNLQTTPTHVSDLVQYANVLVFYDQFTKSARTALRNQLWETTFCNSSFPSMRQATTTTQHCSRKYFNDHCLALTQQIKNVILIQGDDDTAQLLLSYLRHSITVALLPSIEEPQDMEVLRTLIGQVFESGDKFFDCLLLTSNTIRPESVKGAPQMKRLSTLSSFGQSSNMYWCLIGQFLSSTAITMIVDQALERSRNSNAGNAVMYDIATRRLVTFLLRLLKDRDDISTDDDNVMAQHAMVVLTAWMGCDTTQLVDRAFAEFMHELEDSFGWSVSHGYSSFALLTYDCRVIIRRFIEIRIATSEWFAFSQKCLLSVAASSDPIKFGEAFFNEYYVIKSNQGYQKIFDCGILDTSISAMLNDDTRKIYRDEICSLTQDVNKRLLKACSDICSVDQICTLLSLSQKLLYVQSESVSDTLNTNLLADLLARLLRQNNQEMNTEPTQLLVAKSKRYVEVALRICAQSSTERDSISTLSSILLFYICDTIGSNLILQRTSVIPSSATCIMSLRLPISWMTNFLSHHVTFDSNLLKGDGGIVKLKSLLKSCLRHGMRMEDDGANEIRLSCLRLVILLIDFLHGEKNLVGCLGSTALNQSIPSQVFDMVTSHSKFDLLMSSAGSSDVQLEISRILFACITNAADIKFSITTWASLLACFDAGVDGKDLFLRSVLLEYNRIANEASHRLYVDQLRWGEAASREFDQNGWEWLLESIEMTRVYATIENFPVNDSILPHCSIENEMSHGEQNGMETVPKPRDESRRYSLGFLLPLILAALNDDATIQSPKTSQAQHLQNIPAEQRHRPLFLQRFYEKGAIALAISALSCHCPTLRKISVAIIGIFAAALNRQEARNSASWHYRPQIGMLLQSIQRSLVLRLCDDTTRILPESIEVPQLPGFSAIFLARASIILSHPADPIYAAINRAFLRSDEDAGGFQDLTRLPVFVALFCSSVDVPDQLNAERRFALNLVKDGFFEANNYKLLTQCHCPELMLTSIEFASVRSSFGVGDDLQILFVTLSKIIAAGADRAASHLINRLGLVAWARAFLLNKCVFPTVQGCAAFLEMLATVLKLARVPETGLSLEDFVAATRGMAQCVLTFALEQSHNEQRMKQSKGTVGLVCHYSCEILFILSEAQNALNEDTPNADGSQIHCQSDGIQVNCAIRFVEELRPHLHYVLKAVVAFCILPIQIDIRDITSLHQCCKMLVDEHKGLQNQTIESKLAILRRLCFISQHMHSLADGENLVLQSLLLWRGDCVGCLKLRKVWYEIIKTLITMGNDQNVDFHRCISNQSLLPMFIMQREDGSGESVK